MGNKSRNQELQQMVYTTIAYFSLFDFAPTLLEIHRWLLRSSSTESNSITLSQIQEAINTDSRINCSDGVYFLEKNKKDYSTLRKQKYNYTEEKWKHAKKFLPWLAILPGVQSIWFANSVAWCNAREHSDIDIVIISSPEKIWTSRFFTTALMKLLRQRPHEQEHAKALCLSFYIDAEHLHLEQYKIHDEDIHYAFWTTQMYPLYDHKNNFLTFTEYKKKNTWVEKYFVHSPWLETINKREISLNSIQKLLKILCAPLRLFEPLYKKIQMRIMPSELLTQAANGNTVVLSNTIIKLHTNDNRLELQKKWESLQ